MQKPTAIVTVLGACSLAVAAWFSSSHAAQDAPASQLCVVWSSGDPGVAKNVCFMYHLPTHEYLGYVDCRVHLIHGNADEKVYFESSERLEAFYDQVDRDEDAKLHRINGGLHNLRSEPEFDEALKEILK